MPDEKDKGGPAQAAPHRGATPPAPDSSSRLGGTPRSGPGGRPATESAPAPPQVDPAVIAVAVAAATAALERNRVGALATPDMDKTVPGGVYIVDGRVVDAHGNEREMPQEGGGDGADPAAPAR
jgi:hypothetical protein